jgi:hypothetical protein
MNQRKPPRIIESRDNAWLVDGRVCRNCEAENEDLCECGDYEARSYWVTRSRDGRVFYCACRRNRKATLCRHVQAVVKELAWGAGYDLVQFWNHRHEAERQNRRIVELSAKGSPFFVNYAKYSPGQVAGRLDARIDRLGREMAEARCRWYRIGYGQEKYDLRDRMEELNQEINGLLRQRARAANERMRRAA